MITTPVTDKEMKEHGVYIDPDIWYKNPRLAAGLLGFCDGKLGERPDPPKKVKGVVGVYMEEFQAGVNAK